LHKLPDPIRLARMVNEIGRLDAVAKHPVGPHPTRYAAARRFDGQELGVRRRVGGLASEWFLLSGRGSCTTAGREGRKEIGASCPASNLVSGLLLLSLVAARGW